jgi:hypothetical protein
VFYSAYPATTVLNIGDNDALLTNLRRQMAGLQEAGPRT